MSKRIKLMRTLCKKKWLPPGGGVSAQGHTKTSWTMTIPAPTDRILTN